LRRAREGSAGKSFRRSREMSSFYSSASSSVAGKPESKSERNFPGKSEREREKKKRKERKTRHRKMIGGKKDKHIKINNLFFFLLS